MLRLLMELFTVCVSRSGAAGTQAPTANSLSGQGRKIILLKMLCSVFFQEKSEKYFFF